LPSQSILNKARRPRFAGNEIPLLHVATLGSSFE
jgi:hypothetical protein